MDDYKDVLLRIDTHTNRIRNIVNSVVRSMSDTVSILAWTENGLRTNGFIEEADSVHKKIAQMMESYDDIGEFVTIFVGDTAELVRSHKESLDEITTQMEDINKLGDEK